MSTKQKETPYAMLPAGRRRFKTGEVVPLSNGKFSVWGGISYVGTYATRAEAETAGGKP